MNTTTKTFAVTALIAIASSASLVFGHAESTSAKQEIVKLERVVVVGKRAHIETLPRVVVHGYSTGTQMARAKVCSETAVC